MHIFGDNSPDVNVRIYSKLEWANYLRVSCIPAIEYVHSISFLSVQQVYHLEGKDFGYLNPSMSALVEREMYILPIVDKAFCYALKSL